MSKKTLVFGLALSGSVLGLMWAAPARGQSALAQQEADQEKAAQQGTATSSTNAGTAKPATGGQSRGNGKVGCNDCEAGGNGAKGEYGHSIDGEASDRQRVRRRQRSRR